MREFLRGEELDDEEEEDFIFSFFSLHSYNWPYLIPRSCFISEKWRKAMNMKIQSIEKEQYLKTCYSSRRAKSIGVKWIYKNKVQWEGRNWEA